MNGKRAFLNQAIAFAVENVTQGVLSQLQSSQLCASDEAASSDENDTE